RSGKSWLCRQIARDLVKQNRIPLENILCLNFEDYRLEMVRGPQELDEVCQTFLVRVAKPGPKLLLLDELQNVQAWDRFLRTFHDRETDWQILVTGSNAELLSSEFATKLAGRHISFELFPFSFREVLTYRGLVLQSETDIFRNQDEIRILLDNFLIYGGLPERLTI